MASSSAKKDVIRRKLVIVGDGACGKTSLLSVFTLGYFPKEPTVFENHVTDLKIDGKPVQLALWDTAGQEEYERLRPLSYSKAHVILIAFAVDIPDSFENVSAKWIDEVNSLCPGVPVILVGLKKDLRDDETTIAEMQRKGISFVDPKQGDVIAKQIGARKYLECSALTGENVDNVFEAASRAALLSPDDNSTCCCVLL
ncbi:P-loop containing nucleoside triphosphate hydrolase protein [Glomus cerebriforme]|uniref:P-loop containing nucleoside triphosphate hydrolase protein n=1 Tax=Glomus cerebriforme TaxID=658196 RepID=A0A397SCA8_9GLOM|nr:P-loop containing nucleoside triphosphate hydrolase protein [Glomus cerebriforme]